MSYRKKSDPFKVGKVYEVEYTIHKGVSYLLCPLELATYDIKVAVIASLRAPVVRRVSAPVFQILGPRNYIRTTLSREYLKIVQGVTEEELPLYVGWNCYGSFMKLLRGEMPRVRLSINQHVNIRLFQPEDLGRTPIEMM